MKKYIVTIENETHGPFLSLQKALDFCNQQSEADESLTHAQIVGPEGIEMVVGRWEPILGR